MIQLALPDNYPELTSNLSLALAQADLSPRTCSNELMFPKVEAVLRNLIDSYDHSIFLIFISTSSVLLILSDSYGLP